MLRDRLYRRLWIGQAVSQVGDYAFGSTVMLWIAAGLLPGKTYAPAVSAGSLVLGAVVAVLVAPVAGVYVDRWPKVRVARTTTVIRAVIAAGFVGLPLLGAVAPLGVTLAVAGVGTLAEAVAAVFFNPARFVIITDIVPEESRGRAAAMTQASTAVATIVGPLLAALLFVSTGPEAAFGINAATFIISYAALRSAPSPPVSGPFPVAPAAPGARTFGRELLEPLRLIAQRPMLRMLLIAGIVIMLGAGSINALDVYFVGENLHAGPSWYGVISAAFGAGILAGAVLAGVFGARIGFRRVFAGALIAMGMVYVGYAQLATPEPAVVLIFLYGLFAGLVETSMSPLTLAAVPRAVLARVISVFGPAFRLASIVSIVSSGWLVSLMPPGRRIHGFTRIELVFTATAVLILAAGGYASFVRIPSAPPSSEPVAG